MVAMTAIAPVPTALPASRSVSVRDIVEAADISGLSASPDGRLIAYRVERALLETNDYRLDWYVGPVDGSAPPRRISNGGKALFTDAGTLAPEMPHWSPDSRLLFFRAAGDAGIQVWCAPVNGRGAEVVTHDAGDVERFDVAIDGKTLTYSGGPTREAVMQAERTILDRGVLVDTTIDMAQPLIGGAIVAGRRTMKRFTGRWFSRGSLLWNTRWRTVSIDLATGIAHDKGDGPAVASPTGVVTTEVVAANGDRALTVESAEKQTFVVRRANGASIACGAPLCRTRTIDGAAWRPGTDQLVLNVRAGARGNTYFLWRVGSRKTRAIIAADSALNGGRDPRAQCAVTATSMLCVEASATRPPRLMAIDLGRGTRRVLDDPNPSLRSRIDVTAKALTWAGAGGHTFSGVLLQAPVPRQAQPLVIDYYQCSGFLRGGVGTELPMVPLAVSGIAVLCIDATTVPGPQNAVGNYQVGLSGIKAVIDRLSNGGTIDRTRVGMAGLSFGSEVTTWTALHSDILRVAAISSLQQEPAYFWTNALPGRDVPAILKSVWQLGPPDTDPGSWEKVSPAENVDRLRVPLLMQLPESEARLSMEFYARALRAGKPVELHAFADEPHILTQPRHQAASYQRTLDWFGFWLTGQISIDTDPLRQSQFERWRGLARAASRSDGFGRAHP